MLTSFKKIFAVSAIWIIWASTLLQSASAVFEWFAQQSFPVTNYTVENNKGGHWDLIASIQEDFQKYNKCLALAPESLKYKSYNIASGIGGIGQMTNWSIEDIEKLYNESKITQEEYETLSECTYGSNAYSRFLSVTYWETNKLLNGRVMTTRDLAKDYFVEGGMYRLNTGGESYGFINSFYLFNGLPWTNKIDYWLKSVISSDDSYGLIQQPLKLDNTEDPVKTREGLKSWLIAHNQMDTKFLAYSFLSAEPLKTADSIDSKEFNEKLKNYLDNNKTAFIIAMNGKKLGETYEFTAGGIKMLAVGLQLNPFWNLDNKTNFPQPWSYRCSENDGVWCDAYLSQRPNFYRERSTMRGWNYLNMAKQYNYWYGKQSTWFVARTTNPDFLINSQNAVRTNNYALLDNYNARGWYKEQNDVSKELGISDTLYGFANGLTLNGGTWRGRDSLWFHAFYPKNVFSYYDLHNYLANKQYKGEIVKDKENSEDFYFKNGTSKATLDLKQGVYLNSVVSLANVVEGLDKVTENKYNYDWSVNYGFAFSPSKSNANVPMMVLDAFRGKFNPKIYDYFKTSSFVNPLSATPAPAGSLGSVGDFFEDFKSKAPLYSNDDADDGEFISDAKEQYDSEKNKKPLTVIKENNLYGHYRNIKDFDSLVPVSMQVLGNAPTEYISNILASNVVAVENLGEDAHAFKETQKNLTYDVVEKKANSNKCKDIYDSACISEYWKTVDPDPLSLVKYNNVWTVAPMMQLHYFVYYGSNCNYAVSSVYNVWGNTYFNKDAFSVTVNGNTINDNDINVAPFYREAGSKNNINNWQRYQTISLVNKENCPATEAEARSLSTNVNVFQETLKAKANQYNNQTNSSYGRVFSNSSSVKILNTVMVGAGAKAGVGQTTAIYDSKRKLVGALGNYEIDGTNKVTANGRNLGIISAKYLSDFNKTEGNLTLTRNGKKIHTLPFGTYLLDKNPTVTLELNSYVNPKQIETKTPLVFVGDPHSPYKQFMQPPFYWRYYPYQYREFINYGNGDTSKYGSPIMFSNVAMNKQAYGKTDNELYDRVTLPSQISNNRVIGENNSYGIYYLPNSQNKQKILTLTTRIDKVKLKERADLQTNSMSARGYTFGLNAPILVAFESEDPQQTLTPYIQLKDKEFAGQIGNHEIQFSTRKTVPAGEEMQSIEQKVYTKPAILVSFGEDGVVSQSSQYWQSDKNVEGVDKIDTLPYKKPFEQNNEGAVIDTAQRENTRTYFPLKDAFFDGYFKGDITKLPIQVSDNITTNTRENKIALINTMLLNLINNNANVNFGNLKKVNDLVQPSVYFLEDDTEKKFYILMTVIDDKTVNGKWTWALPILIDGKQGQINIYNKVKVNTALERFQKTLGVGVAGALGSDYYFTYSGANTLGGVVVDANDIYSIPADAISIKNIKAVFARSNVLFKDIIGVSKVQNRNPLDLPWISGVKEPHEIKSLTIAKDEEVTFADDSTLEFDKYLMLKNWYWHTEEDGNLTPLNPTMANYLTREAFLGSTQYIFGLNKTLIPESHKKGIVDYEMGTISEDEYNALNIADWEKDYIDNEKTNLWLYKMSYQDKKFITVFNMNHYTNAGTNAPDKQIIGSVTGESNASYASTDPDFKLNNSLLNYLQTLIPANDIISKTHYDVAYKLNNDPITSTNSSGIAKGRINIMGNFSKVQGMTIAYLGNMDLLDKMTTELRCWGKPTKVINFATNNGVWISHDTYDLFQGKNPQECYLQFNIQTPSNAQEAVKLSGQKFEFEINLDTKTNPKGLGEKKHTFELKSYNISDTQNITDIESIPKCRIVAKTKSTAGSADTIGGTSINDNTSTVELDVWYKNPELMSSNNYVTQKALLGTYINLELTGNAQFQNFNAEYYSTLAKKQAMSYSTGLNKNEYSEKLQSILSGGAAEYSQKKIKMFVGGSHYKKNKFYGKTTFTVEPLNGNINEFSFKVKGNCEFIYLNDTKKLNSDTSISFTYPKTNGQKDTWTMSYYNPINKHAGTLFSTGYSKVKATDNGATVNLLVKQYYPSILSVTYNHVSAAQGIDGTSKIQGVDNGLNNSDVQAGDINTWGKGCITAQMKTNSPNHWVNGTASQCLQSGGIGGSAWNYTINHPAKGGTGYGHWIINIISGTWENVWWDSHLVDTDTTSHSWNRSGRTKHACTHWVRNWVWNVDCGEATFQSKRINITNNGVNAWEKLGQGFGGYYYLGLDGSFEIDKKIVGKENDGNSKVFFDKILPICMDSGTTNGRYRTLTLSEKEGVIMIDNGWELNNTFKNSINGKVCNVDPNAITLNPIVDDALYTYDKKEINDENVIDKFTGFPFFMKSAMKGKVPSFNGAWGNTGVQATIDKKGMIQLYLHEELLKAINNKPENVKIEMRFIDADKANAINYGTNTVPWGSSFQSLGGHPVGSAPLNTQKEGKVKVMFRVGFKLNINDIKWPSEIKNNKLYQLLDSGIKDLKKDKVFEMQLPVVVMSSYGESFANSGSTMNEVFLEKTGQTTDGLKASLTDNFDIQMKYKKFAASSYRTGHNTTKSRFRRHRACWRRRCRNRTSRWFSGQTQQYNSTSQSNDYIRGFNPTLTNMSDVVRDNIVHTFYPYTDNTGDQINNKTVLINGIPSIKNIDKNQVIYQGVCNVCNQYRGNIFEQHPIGAFNPEHNEKGSNQNIFDYYTDTRNFTVIPVHNTTKKEVTNISWDISGKTLATQHKEPFVTRMTFEPEVKVVEILPTSVEDSTKSALKYYGQKAVVVGKKNAGEAPATLLISGDIIPSDFDNLWKKKIESELVIVSEGDIVIGSDVNFVNAILVTKGNLIIMPWNTGFKLHGGAIINGKIMNYRTNITDIRPSSYSVNYQTYLKNLDLFDMKYPVLFTIDPRFASSKIFTFIGSVSKTSAR